jgi:hypothetical protein
MDWVKKLQRERSHIATIINMNPKFMFLTIIVVVGDHNYRNLIRVRYRIMFSRLLACLLAKRLIIMPTSNVLHTTSSMTPINCKDAKMKSQKKGGEYLLTYFSRDAMLQNVQLLV